MAVCRGSRRLPQIHCVRHLPEFPHGSQIFPEEIHSSPGVRPAVLFHIQACEKGFRINAEEFADGRDDGAAG